MNGLLKSIASSNTDGVKLGYRYDEANRLQYVDDGSQLQAPGSARRTTAYAYNANGSLETVTGANGIVHAYTYDTLNRLRTLNVKQGASIVHSYEYKLRASGHRQQIVEGSKTTTFGYDALYRLTSETVAGGADPGRNGTITYGLDKVGNRESRISSVPSVANSFNSRDWLSGDTYDANGNTLTSSQPVTLITQPDVYDFEDRLIIRTKTDGSTVNLAYDADGILRQKTLLSPLGSLLSATGYLTDTQNPTGYAQVMEERINTAAGTTVKTYTYGADLISSSTLAPSSPLPALSFYTYDGLASVRELTNATGGITDTYDYDAFGILVYRFGATDNAYQYRGERFESDINQYYLRARFYNQATGRFWNQDTYEGATAEPASLHKYLYANANPVTGWDPSGQFTLVEAMTAFTTKALLVRALVGAAIGAVDSALSGRNLLLGAVTGAMFGMAGPAIPWQIGLPLAANGLVQAAQEDDWDTFAFRAGVLALGFGLSNYAQGQPGGRWGGFSTRLQDSRLALWFQARGFKITFGGGQGPQEYIPPGPGRSSRTFVDMTATKGNTTVRVQTVTVDQHGTPIPAELAAQARINNAFPNDQLILVPKTEQGVVLLPVMGEPEPDED